MGNSPKKATEIEPESKSAEESSAKRGARKQVLSNFKKQQIRSSWIIAQKPKTPVGERIFVRVFKRCPEMQQLFGFKDKTLAQIKVEPSFLKHAATVQSQLQHLIDNLDNLDQLESELFRLGLRHADIVRQLQSNRFVLAKYWDSIAEAIVFCVTEGQKFPGLYGAWRVLICWMVNQMRDGLMSHKLLTQLEFLHENAIQIAGIKD